MATIRCGGIDFENIQAVLFDKDGTLANVEHYLSLLGQLRADFVATRITEDRRSPAVDGVLSSQLLTIFGQGDGWIDPSGLMAVGSRECNEVAAAACMAAAEGLGWGVALAQVKAAFSKADAALPLKVAQTPLLEGVSQLFSVLASADVTLGIVSSDVHQEVEAFVDYYKCEEIGWYCGASDEHLPKTHPDFLNFACEALMVSPLATLIVGDSASDLALAQQGSAGFVAMLGGWSRSPVIEGVDTAVLDMESPAVVGAEADSQKAALDVSALDISALDVSALKVAAIRSLQEVEVFK